MQLLELPRGVRIIWLDKKESNMRFIDVVKRNGRAFRPKLDFYRKKIASDGVICVFWPKKRSVVATDISEDTLREVALPFGLVDVKVCAVDEVWSALNLM